MNPHTRIDRLERRPYSAPRCDACRAWPAWRLIHRSADGREEEPSWTCPAACAACGFRPRLVVVMIPAALPPDLRAEIDAILQPEMANGGLDASQP